MPVFRVNILLKLLLSLLVEFVVPNLDAQKYIEKDGGWNVIVSNEYKGKTSKQICPFPRLNANVHTFQDVMDQCFMIQQPCLIKNVMKSYPAIKSHHWHRSEFYKRYGKLKVKADSRSNLPFSQGESHTYLSLKQYLNKSANSIQQNVPLREFVFDFFDGMKGEYFNNKNKMKLFNKFKKDIPTPTDKNGHEFFRFFGDHSSYELLSLGGNGGGIDYHFHGDTWLALLFGVKSWYIYPPGKIPREVHNSVNLLTSNWKKLSVDDNNYNSPGAFRKPIYCQQRSGDVMYLPQLFAHATYNHGEAIAFGGQYPIDETVALKTYEHILKKRPEDPIALWMLWGFQRKMNPKKKRKKFPFQILKERPYDLTLAIDGVEQCLKHKKRYKLGKKILSKWFNLLQKYFLDLENYDIDSYAKLGNKKGSSTKDIVDPTVLASSFYTLEAKLNKYNITKKLNLSWSFLSNSLNKKITNPKYKMFFNELLSRYKKSSYATEKNNGHSSYILSSIISTVRGSPMEEHVFDSTIYEALLRQHTSNNKEILRVESKKGKENVNVDL